MPEVASGPSKMVKSLSGGKNEFVDRTLPYVCLSDGKHDIVNRTLPYTIYSHSKSSPGYGPENLLRYRSSDAKSRWSAPITTKGGFIDESDRPFVILELKEPAVLTSVQFGKGNKRHPCNAQSVKILAGPSPVNLREVGDFTLQNNSTPETVSVRNTSRKAPAKGSDCTIFVVRYIQILPGPPYEPGFHTGLWSVSLSGDDSRVVVDAIQSHWNEAQLRYQNRLMLKHFRNMQMEAPYQSLLASFPEDDHILEHPKLTRLFDILVRKGDFESAEGIIEEMLKERKNSLMSESWANLPTIAKWDPLIQKSGATSPCSRRDHSLCSDGYEIFLFGGRKDGTVINDFWTAKSDGSSLLWQEIGRPELNDPWPDAMFGYKMAANKSFIFLIGGKTDYQALPLASMAHNAGLVAYESIDMPVPTYGKKLWVYDRSKCLWNSHHLPKLHEGWYQADWAIRALDNSIEVYVATLSEVNRILAFDCQSLQWIATDGIYSYTEGEQRFRTLFEPVRGNLFVIESHSQMERVHRKDENYMTLYAYNIDRKAGIIVQSSTTGITKVDKLETEPPEGHNPLSDYTNGIDMAYHEDMDAILWIRSCGADIQYFALRLQRLERFALVKRDCLYAIRKQKFSELVSRGETALALEFLKGPLQEALSDKGMAELRTLASSLIRSTTSPTSSDILEPATNAWAERVKVYEFLMHFMDEDHKQPDIDLLDTIPF